MGSYHCSCKPGYIRNGRNCTVDPCQLHTVLNDEDRDIENVEEGEKCDSELETGWYRFLDIPGIRMPTKCPPTDTRCGTSWPGWLKGDHPTVDDAIVTRTVKFRRRKNCEEKTLFDIKVKNCSSFFVYLLRSTAGCTYRYCYSF
ncbi:pancreatic secretory granule membrane major glycoprotein GP2-like [Stylophora pistillata]|uniref:pancreatic secretory granule membrane major glycoprotein GP2-like n=1 Tax=Stylophora pistillata TaxID=50429 RepID=UPI000C03955A|nr:pancreatic secretory granule membrane major glycoprotein GP2-like [Stylophora pistillata]